MNKMLLGYKKFYENAKLQALLTSTEVGGVVELDSEKLSTLDITKVETVKYGELKVKDYIPSFLKNAEDVMNMTVGNLKDFNFENLPQKIATLTINTKIANLALPEIKATEIIFNNSSIKTIDVSKVSYVGLEFEEINSKFSFKDLKLNPNSKLIISINSKYLLKKNLEFLTQPIDHLTVYNAFVGVVYGDIKIKKMTIYFSHYTDFTKLPDCEEIEFIGECRFKSFDGLDTTKTKIKFEGKIYGTIILDNILSIAKYHDLDMSDPNIVDLLIQVDFNVDTYLSDRNYYIDLFKGLE